MNKTPKRFIAGAVCPRCAALDVLVIYADGKDEYRECVECGFLDKMQFKSHVKELTTRVNKTQEELENETQVLTIVGISKNKKRK